MRFDVITLFPEMFVPFFESGVTRRAFESKQVDVRTWNPRTFALGNYHRVDDRPFGGGPGMVMMAEPLAQALSAVKQERDDGAQVVLFSPVGERLTQEGVMAWAQSEGAVLVCGRYEGVDQRFIDRHVDVQISLGDFVLSGGELAAMALLDAVARLLPGVLHHADSSHMDSFSPGLDGLLDCHHFTRPEEWGGMPLPAVLLSGNHAQIARWRRERSLELTARTRPDLIAAVRAKGLLDKADEAFLAACK